MSNLNLFECTQSWLRCRWLLGVSISYAGVLNSFGFGLFYQILIDLWGEIKKKAECSSKYKWTELNLSFLWVWSRCWGAGLNTESFFCPGSFVCRVEGGVTGIRRVTKLFTFPLLFFFFLFTQMNSSIPCFHAIKCPCLCGRMVQKQVMQKGEIGLYLSSSIEPAFFSSLFISLCLPRLCLPVCLALRCDVSVVFSQTQPVTLWAAGCCHRRLHTDGISLPHPPSYIKFATGPL